MSGSTYAANALFSANAQQSLLAYVGAWSQFSLSQARLDPFALKNLPPSMQAGINSGDMYADGMEVYAGAGYAARASTYEKVLLVSLGVDPIAIETFVTSDVGYGDYFADPLHPWQEDDYVADRVVGQLMALREALDLCRERLSECKRLKIYKVARGGLDVERFLGDPLRSLQGILENNIGRARFAFRRHGMTEEGLMSYFGPRHAKRSGSCVMSFHPEDVMELSALETLPPPPIA